MYIDYTGLPSENSWRIMAKIIDDKHYIKCINTGNQFGVPVAVHSSAFNFQTIKPSSLNNEPTKFRLVNEECFENYVKYLQSKNDLFYRTTLSLGGF
jgi:hypothetical protein